MSRFIAITGPECSGKTELAAALADELQCEWVPEYAREYLEHIGRAYRQSDLSLIAHHQHRLWQEALERSGTHYVIKDSDQTVMRIWSEVRYGSMSKELKQLYEAEHNLIHVLCTPDIPWEPDPFRENPDDRQDLFDLYEISLKQSNRPYIVVSGALHQRVKAVIAAISELSESP